MTIKNANNNHSNFASAAVDGPRPPDSILGNGWNIIYVVDLDEVDEDGVCLTETFFRPDWLDPKSASSSIFRTKVLEEATTYFTNTTPDGETSSRVDENELSVIVDQYWYTCAGNYKAQEGIDGADQAAAQKVLLKLLQSRQSHIVKARHEKYHSGPLPPTFRTLWFQAIFSADMTAEQPILGPVFLSEDNLPSGPRWQQVGSLTEASYWKYRTFGRFVGDGEAWEVLHVWWASEELRTISMMHDAYIRQTQTNQRLYWSGLRSKWCDINGERVLPEIRRELAPGKSDPMHKNGHIIYEWMVDKEYVRTVFGEAGASWCSRLYPDPTIRAPLHGTEPLEVIQRSEYRNIKNLYQSWSQHIHLEDDANQPTIDEITDSLLVWEEARLTVG